MRRKGRVAPGDSMSIQLNLPFESHICLQVRFPFYSNRSILINSLIFKRNDLGLVSECQTQRSQIQNRKVAIDKLRARLYQIKIDQQLSSTRSSRKLQVGTSGRSEKIRTYNYPQDRVTDHRINFTSHNLEDFLRGARPFETLLQKLEEASQKERLVEFLDRIESEGK